MFPAVLIAILTLVAAPAFAQGPYVGAAVGMDISRFTHVDAGGFDNNLTAGGEAVNFSLRVGTAVGQRWGAELGFTYPAEVKRESSRGFPIPLLANAGVLARPDIAIAIPALDATTRTERRNTTLDTVAWFAQPVSDRVDLVYLGGVAFNRIVEDVSFQFTRRITGIVLPTSTRTTTYDVSPVAGMEARIGLTDHVLLVPGVRLQSIGGTTTQGGWLVRPSAGLTWRF